MKLPRYFGTVALAVAASGAVIALYVDRGSVTTDESKKREGQLVVAWRRADVGEIQIEHGASTFTITKVDGDFRLRAPNGGDDELADSGAVERLLAAFEYARPLRTASEGSDLGFSPPRASIRLKMGKLTVHAELGRETTVAGAGSPEGASYARINGKAPVVVTQEFAETLMRGVDAYREKRITPYLSPTLASAQFDSAQGSALVGREGEAPFRLTRMEKVRPRRERMDRVWVGLVDLRAESFVEIDVAERAIAASADRLVIRLVSKIPNVPPAELAIGGDCDLKSVDGQSGTYAVRRMPRPVAACVNDASVKDLRVTDARLADRGITTFQADEISELSFQRGDDRRDWARTGATFRERAPNDRPLDEAESERLKVWLEAMVRDETSTLERDVVSGGYGVHPNEPPQTRGVQRTGETPLLISIRAGGREEKIEITDGYVKRADDGGKLLASAHLWNLLSAREIASDRVTPWAIRPDAADVTSVSVSCEGKSHIARKTETAWTPASVDPARVMRVVGAYFAVDADPRTAWIGNEDNGGYGIGYDNSGCTVQVEWVLRPGPNTPPSSPKTRAHTLWLGAPVPETSGRLYARFSGSDGVFTVQTAFREQLKRGFQTNVPNIRDSGAQDAIAP